MLSNAHASQQYNLAQGTSAEAPAEGLVWDVTTLTVKLHCQAALTEQ